MQPMTPNDQLRPMRSLRAATPPLHFRGVSRVSEIARPKGRSAPANDVATFLAKSKSCASRFFGKLFDELDEEASETSTRLTFSGDIDQKLENLSPTGLPEKPSDNDEVAALRNPNFVVCETPKKIAQTAEESLSTDLCDIQNVRDRAKQLTFPT